MARGTGPAIAGLGRRTLAAVIDRVPPGLLGLGWYLLAFRGQGIIWSVLFGVLLLTWVVVQWWTYATRKAGLGYRLTGLQLVGLRDGKPIGWWRMFLRTVVLTACWALVLPGIALVIFLVIQERHQGWHDLTAGSVAVDAPLDVRPVQPDVATPRRTAVPVALPPHLLQASFQAPAEPEVAAPMGPIEHVPMPVERASQVAVAPIQHAPEPTANPASPSGPVSSFAGPGVQPAGPVQSAEPALPTRPYAVAAPETGGGTRLVAPAATRASGWRVHFDDGRELPLNGLMLIGRAPVGRADDA